MASFRKVLFRKYVFGCGIREEIVLLQMLKKTCIIPAICLLSTRTIYDKNAGTPFSVS